MPDQTLPEEPTQAQRFEQTRTARGAAMLEDYAELIADLLAAGGEARATDIARRFGVSHATAVKTIARLRREGLATGKPYRGVFPHRGWPSAGRTGAQPAPAGGRRAARVGRAGGGRRG